ncbi:hypothetical protein Tco_1395134 [Tanacetum coccineum]
MLTRSLAHFHFPEVFLKAVSLLSGLPESRGRICLHSTSPIPCSGGIGYVVVVLVVDVQSTMLYKPSVTTNDLQKLSVTTTTTLLPNPGLPLMLELDLNPNAFFVFDVAADIIDPHDGDPFNPDDDVIDLVSCITEILPPQPFSSAVAFANIMWPLPPPMSPPSTKLMIMDLEEYGYQSRRGIRVPKK